MEIVQSGLRVVWKKLLVKLEGSIPFSKTNQDRDTLSMPRKDEKRHSRLSRLCRFIRDYPPSQRKAVSLPVIDHFRIHVMFTQALPGNLLPGRAGFSVVAVRIQRNSAARKEPPPHLNVFGIQKGNQVLHDPVDDILMKVAMVAEGKQVKFQRLAFDNLFVRHVGNDDIGIIRLAGNGALAGKFRAVRLDKIVIVRMLVGKAFQQGGIILRFIFRIPTPEFRQIFFCSHLSHPFH